MRVLRFDRVLEFYSRMRAIADALAAATAAAAFEFESESSILPIPAAGGTVEASL